MLTFRSMYARSLLDDEDVEQRIVLHSMRWRDFERLLAVRGDRAGPRMYFLDGEIELMSPGSIHEFRKTKLARLLETWALESDVDLEGFGSWTLKRAPKKAGAEPDECYIVGSTRGRRVPDLAIEVEWSRGALEKHVIYERLGVRELWTLRKDGRLAIRVLTKGKYVERTRSALLPKLDVAWLARFIEIDPQSRAVRSMRDEMRKGRRRV